MVYVVEFNFLETLPETLRDYDKRVCEKTLESDMPFHANAYISGKLKLDMLNTNKYELSGIIPLKIAKLVGY